MSTDTQNFKPIYDELFKAISEIDEFLDSVSDQKSAGKRAVTNALVNEQEKNWTTLVESIVQAVTKFDLSETETAGVYFGLVKALRETYEKDCSAVVETLVSEAPQPSVTATEDELKSASEKRSEIYKQLKMMRDLAIMLGGSEADFPAAKKRTGARGPRGPRAISLFDWSVNGNALEGEKNTLNWIAKEFGYEKSAALRAAMKEAGIDTSKPGDTITFTLKDGSILVGAKRDSDDDLPDDEDDDDFDEDSDDE